MTSYVYTWTPFFIVAAAAVLLTIPYLALIALMIVLLAALAALAWAVVSVPLMVGRTIGHRWHGQSGASPQSTAALPPPISAVRRTRSVQAVLFADPPSRGDE